MKRLFLAAGLALIFHGLLFSLKADWLSHEPVMTGEQKSLSLTMSYRYPPQRLSEPVASPPPEETIKPPPPAETPSPIPSRPAEIKPAPEEGPPTVIPEPPRFEPSEMESTTAHGYPVNGERTAKKDHSVIPDAAVKDAGRGLIKTLPTIYPRPYEDNPRPQYPGLARRRGYEGVVILEILVSRQGEVLEANVSETSGHPLLDEEARRTVKKYRFEPGREGGEKVDMWIRIPIRFQLQN